MISQRNTSRTWARHSPGLRKAPVLALGHVSCPIRPITGRPLLFPTSQYHPSFSLPCGRLALHRGTGQSDNVSTFHVIILTDNLGAV